MTVYVCPEKDIVCGDAPARWCESCTRKKHREDLLLNAAIALCRAENKKRVPTDGDVKKKFIFLLNL